VTAPPKARFTAHEADVACEQWRFNCGPGALCLLFGLRPDEVRPHLDGFERKGYTNPLLMYGALRSLGRTWKRLRSPNYPKVGGLVRMQWGGPWCNPGVPPRAAYRHTHWIASWHDGDQLVCGGQLTFWRWRVAESILWKILTWISVDAARAEFELKYQAVRDELRRQGLLTPEAEERLAKIRRRALGVEEDP
jgi:hypothetical protein